MINPDSEIAPYRQVAYGLRARIEAGEWPPGGYLPSEPYIASEYGVGRDTVRRAIALLRSEGAVRSGGMGRRWQVPPTADRMRVWVERDSRVVIRPPTAAERRDLSIPEGVAVAEVHHGGEVRLVRGDEAELWFD